VRLVEALSGAKPAVAQAALEKNGWRVAEAVRALG
jgi:hypothetical protein